LPDENEFKWMPVTPIITLTSLAARPKARNVCKNFEYFPKRSRTLCNSAARAIPALRIFTIAVGSLKCLSEIVHASLYSPRTILKLIWNSAAGFVKR
jgi:hypothetical protein